jgi:glyoxalase family protein
VGSLGYWKQRIEGEGVELRVSNPQSGREMLSFTDPDGLPLAIVELSGSRGTTWRNGPVPPGQGITGFEGVTITEQSPEETANLLTDVMGFKPEGAAPERHGFRAGGEEGNASRVDLIGDTDARRGSLGAGVVHHIAFRTPGDAEQLQWREKLERLNYHVSPVMDRIYFHSIYFREPGGVLFEIATDTPGFTADQSAAELGTRLMLPPWLEDQRSGLVQVLPPVRIPKSAR